MTTSKRRAQRWRGLVASVVAIVGLAAHGADDAAAAPAEAPLAPVLQAELRGDLVMAGNSNLISAGGWRSEHQAVADVDGDTSLLCIGRDYVPAACADNSSSAMLDIPPGARVVAARLYVATSVGTAVKPLRARLDGPGAGFAYTDLTLTTPGIPKIGEAAGSSVPAAAAMRQAVWDVTEYVQANGPGAYTVADIAFERTGAFLPYASWAIVAAYELDPGADLAAMTPAQQARFAPRAVTWYDGLSITADSAVDVTIGGFEVPVGHAVFGKTFHVVAHAQHRGADNLLFAGQPLGNNAGPGEPSPPLGVVVGDDPACNTTTRILDDSICHLGAPVTTKAPGPTAYYASTDGRTSSSGSGVDMDVVRIPARYFVPGTTEATLSLRTVGRTPVATGVLAASIDLPIAPTGDAAGDPAGDTVTP